MNQSVSSVSVGIVGLGRAGWHLHLLPISKNPNYRIIGVADPAEDRCQEACELTGCNAYPTIDRLLAESDASLVVVATPSTFHFSDASKVLNAGRHCIIEKPMAANEAEAAELVALARKKNVKLFAHHNHLHHATYHHLRHVLDRGILGPLYHMRVFWGNYARRWDWQTLKKNGGGQLNNTCPHALSVILQLLDSSVKRVYADLRNIKDAGDAEDHVHVVMTTESGVTVDLVVSSAIALSGPKWMLCGKYGTLTSDGNKSHVKYYDPTLLSELSVLDAASPGRQYLKETIPWIEEELEADPCPVKTFHENVHDVITAGATPVVSAESGAEVIRVIDLIRKSSMENGRV